MASKRTVQEVNQMVADTEQSVMEAPIIDTEVTQEPFVPFEVHEPQLTTTAYVEIYSLASTQYAKYIVGKTLPGKPYTIKKTTINSEGKFFYVETPSQSGWILNGSYIKIQ